MWKTPTIGLFFLAVGLAVPVPLFGGEAAWSPAEATIWQLEQGYLERLQAEDLTGLEDYWHEQFIGWPSHAAEPVDRASSQASIAELLETIRIVSFRVQPLLIRVFEDVAVVQYLLHSEMEAATGEKAPATYRMTHTWLRGDGRWQIIGGMSSRITR